MMTLRPRTRSARLDARALELTPGGVHSNVRLRAPRVTFDHGKGAWLWDVDGNDYLDYLLGQGPNFLGHAPDPVVAAVDDAMHRGVVFGGQHALENEAGEIFLDTVRWAERVRFGVSGTEADQAALRLARAATGRSAVVRFHGHYHGWLDNVLASTVDGVAGPGSDGQPGRYLDDSRFLPFNDADALRELLASDDDIAAVILEPVMCNNGAVPPRDGFLETVRELCDQHGVVLIFDEVITGFRVALGGAAQRYGVTPDLAVYGKAMAGGLPVAAVAGRADLMDLFGTGQVTHAGTFNASMFACAAVVAALTMLRDDPPYERIEAHGTQLMKGIGELGTAAGLPLRLQGLPMAFHVSFGAPEPVHDLAGVDTLDLDRYARLVTTLVEHGLWVAGRGIWYVSAAHGDRELEVALERFEAGVAAFDG